MTPFFNHSRTDIIVKETHNNLHPPPKFYLADYQLFPPKTRHLGLSFISPCLLFCETNISFSCSLMVVVLRWEGGDVTIKMAEMYSVYKR